jgi:hypothetical protein
MHASGPTAVQSSPRTPAPALQEPVSGTQNDGEEGSVPTWAQVNPSGQADPPSASLQGCEQNLCPLKGQFSQVLSRQLALGFVGWFGGLTQSSSVMHAAQSVPSIFGSQVRLVRSQEGAKPHWSRTVAGSVLSQ